MRNGQKRMRGRGGNNHRKSQNPLTRVYESNGPDVKIRGTASHVAEKYIQLARDAQSSGDPVAAENYYQHAEHYFRLIAAAQEQFRQQNPYYNQQPQPQQQGAPGQQNADEGFDGDDDDGQPFMGQNEPSYGPREPQQQPYLPRDAQPFPPRDQQVHNRPQHQPQQYQQQPNQGGQEGGQEVGGLPAFITGGGSSRNRIPARTRTVTTRATVARIVSACIAGADVIAAVDTVLIAPTLAAVNSKAQRPSRLTTKAVATSPGSRSKRRPAPARGQSAAG